MIGQTIDYPIIEKRGGGRVSRTKPQTRLDRFVALKFLAEEWPRLCSVIPASMVSPVSTRQSIRLRVAPITIKPICDPG